MSPERDERVRRRSLNKIQKTLATMRRVEHDDVHAHAYVRDVTKLLSLFDSQAAGGDFSRLAHEIVSEYNSADDPGLLRRKVAEGLTTVANDVATRMRNRCVEKVEAAVWLATKDFKGVLNEVQRRAIALATATYVEAAVKSETLQREQEKRP